MINNMIKQINIFKRNRINKRLNITVELMEEIIRTELSLRNVLLSNTNKTKILLDGNIVKITINGEIHSEIEQRVILNSLDNYKVTPIKVLKMLLLYYIDRGSFILQYIEDNMLSKEEYRFVEDLINGVV